jgi:hypothetical protein
MSIRPRLQSYTVRIQAYVYMRERVCVCGDIMIENNVVKLKYMFCIKILVTAENVRQIIEVQFTVNLFLGLIKHESMKTCEKVGIDPRILNLDTM